MVQDSVFRATDTGVLVPDLSDVEVAVTGSGFQQVAFGIEADTSRRSTSAGGQAIGYPASRRSRGKVKRSRFADTRLAAILVTELGPSLVDLNVVDNALALAAPSQAGIVGLNVEGARLRHNIFRGEGYAGVVAKDSTHWRINNNDFCDLVVPGGRRRPIWRPTSTLSSRPTRQARRSCSWTRLTFS
jgi:hypothetical protein